MLILILLACVIAIKGACTCTYQGVNYSCGAVIAAGLQICCVNGWEKCNNHPVNPFGCRCGRYFKNEHFNAVDNRTVITYDYKLTADGHLFSQYVTVANLSNNIYVPDRYVHSTKLALNDMIIWPASDIGGASDTNVIMKLEHLNLDRHHLNCCASISVGFPPACQVKVCCGTGCCC